MSQVPWIEAFGGGALIGLSVLLFMLTLGRIVGVSGIAAQLLSKHAKPWQRAFILGLMTSGVIYQIFVQPLSIEIKPETPSILLITSGLLVGYGTRLGSGCTSGHGICGLARFSKRSVAATLTFMGSGILTVYAMNQLLGG